MLGKWAKQSRIVSRMAICKPTLFNQFGLTLYGADSIFGLNVGSCQLSQFKHPTAACLSSSATTGVPTDHFDICIVGAGIIGTAAACAMAQSPYSSGKRIALIEAGDLFKSPVLMPGQFANRVSSITRGSALFLDQIGVWDRILVKHPYTKMHVWDASSDGVMAFDADSSQVDLKPHGEPAIGWIVQNHLIQASLAQIVSQTPSITIFNSSTVTDISADALSGVPTVVLNNGHQFSCQLLVGADGMNSKVREFAGIESIGWDYNMHGLVATLQVDDSASDNDTAWQRFLPTGPIAMLPLAKGYASLVWSTTPHLASLFKKMSDAHFVEFVNCAFHNPLQDLQFACDQLHPDGSIDDSVNLKDEIAWGLERSSGSESGESRKALRVIGVQPYSRAPFPLRLRNSTSYTSTRTALVGDAAHTIHPLAGQGLNLGLADAQSLCKAIEQGSQHGSDVGSSSVCEAYGRDRFAKGVGMLAAVDGVARAFGGMIPSALRSTGMNLINSSSVVKKTIMNLAS
ncbi:putative ubiquinone biosynthesis monooxygenase [Batrachochytrium dendrobatidis]